MHPTTQTERQALNTAIDAISDVAPDPLQAMARRALIGLMSVQDDSSRPFWMGYAKALISLADGSAAKLAQRDARLFAQQVDAGYQGAWTRLTEGIEALTGVEVQQRFAAEGVQITLDAAATFQLNAVEHFKHHEATLVDGDDYVAALAVFINHGAGLSHRASVANGVAP